MNYKAFVNHVFSSQNSCIIHGLAGTGKSTLVQELARRYGERCLKLAPTGLTAYNIDGTTVDSLLKCYQEARERTLNNMQASYDCIIVDEISMIHEHKLDAVFGMAETLHKRRKMMRLILIGDPFQLPPVVTPNMRQAYSEKRNVPLEQSDFYFFKSKRFRNYFGGMECYLLARNFRQNDEVFIKVLGKIAMGSADKYDLDFINQRVIPPSSDLQPPDKTVITPYRDGVGYFNRIGLERLGEQYHQEAVFEKLLPGYQDIASEHRDIVEPISYALDAPVVFTQNDVNGYWVNGTRGKIKARRQDHAGTTILEIATDRGQVVACGPTRHELKRFVFNRQTGSVDNECVAIVRQFPFIIGFALTVHKCQGMTLNEMIFNTGQGCFAPGQLYVALSRVKDLNRLTLDASVKPGDVFVSDAVRNYFNYFQGRCVMIA
jgi:ATP-dependent exoDNAse (exonuclease V) alpha subunit